MKKRTWRDLNSGPQALSADVLDKDLDLVPRIRSVVERQHMKLETYGSNPGPGTEKFSQIY